MIQGIEATAKGQLVCGDDTGIHSKQGTRDPPANWISQEVNLLTGVVVGPERDATQQEGPLVWLGSVGVGRGKLVVVPEHGALQLEPLLEEGQVLDLALGLLAALVVGRQRLDLVDVPDVAGGCDLLVAVDLLLAEAPLGQRRRMRPHGHL